jgi:hypothetical protein
MMVLHLPKVSLPAESWHPNDQQACRQYKWSTDIAKTG